MTGFDAANWCLIPGALLSEPGILWLREPACANRSELVDRLRSGRYDKPFVSDDGEMRRLHFSLGFTQSEMSLGEPDALTLRYARKMMAFLLFAPNPRHVVIVGLGGGSLTKFCHRQLTRTRVTSVEVNPEVIALGALFDLPRPSVRLQTVQADARDYFSNPAVEADVVLMDGCDSEGTALELCSEEFYGDARARLSPQGILVGNVAGVRARTGGHLRSLSRVFEGRVLTIHLRDCANRLVFAFNDDRAPDWLAVAQRVGRLTLQHGLDFHKFEKRLRHAYARQAGTAGW